MPGPSQFMRMSRLIAFPCLIFVLSSYKYQIYVACVQALLPTSYSIYCFKGNIGHTAIYTRVKEIILKY